MNLQSLYPQFSIEGSQNIWISKPSYNSRGIGISLVNDIKDIVVGKSKLQSNKILQKYIERPLLLPFKVDNKTELRKFDI